MSTTLLTLEHVGKRFLRGRREHVALRDVSLALDAGELVAIWGRRGSGRTTLLRVAAGVETPDEGTVRFEGQPVDTRGAPLLGGTIGYVQSASSPALVGQGVVEHVTMPLLARGESPARAAPKARAALERVGAAGSAKLRIDDLDTAETIRVSIAQALAARVRVLCIDEPTTAVGLLERDEILRLLRSIAAERVAVLMTASEAIGLSGVDRVLSMSAGELRNDVVPASGAVVPLELRRASSS